MRDKVVRAICNFLLNHVASQKYGGNVSLLIDQGLYHANNGNGPFIVYKPEDSKRA